MANYVIPGMVFPAQKGRTNFIFHPPDSAMWIQACDKHEINKKMNIEKKELFSPCVIEKSLCIVPCFV